MANKKLKEELTKNASYWKTRREIQSRDKLLSRSIEKAEREFKKIYKGFSDDLFDMLKGEIEEMQKENHSETHEFNYVKFADMKKQIDRKIREMGDRERTIMSDGMIDVYKQSQKIVDTYNKWTTLPVGKDKDIRRIIDSVWCPEGNQLNWSQRLWMHQQELASRLAQDITEAVESGIPLSEFSKKLKKETGKEYYQVDRLYRTENAHIATVATNDRYKQAGVKQYQFVCFPGEYTCPECKDLDGRIYNLDDQIIGQNCPPIHPNCRCTTIAVLTPDILDLKLDNKEED